MAMLLKEVTLFCQNLDAQRAFYEKVLGFEIWHGNDDSFTIQTGQSKLKFARSKQNYHYHYCFLIPSNQIKEALKWLEERLEPIVIEGQKIIEPTTMWDAESIYFMDGAGNIAELIARHDLKNDSTAPFNSASILNFNEMGAPSSDIKASNTFLKDTLGTSFYTGDLKRFGTHGDEHGMFLLVNNTMKDTWFPTQLFPESAPFDVLVQVGKQSTNLRFRNGKFERGELLDHSR